MGVTEVYERCMFFFERYHHRGNWWFVYYTSSPIHRAKELVFEGNTSILPKVLVINEPKVREIRKQAVNRR